MNPRRRYMVTAGIFGALMLGIIGGALVPLFLNAQKRSVALDQIRMELAGTAAVVQNAGQLRLTFEEQKERMAAVEDAFLRPSSITRSAAFLKLLETTVRESGNILVHDQFSTVQDPERGPLFLVDLEIRGNHLSLLSLLSKLEHFPLLLVIDDISITRIEPKSLTPEDLKRGLSDGAILSTISWHMPVIVPEDPAASSPLEQPTVPEGEADF